MCVRDHRLTPSAHNARTRTYPTDICERTWYANFLYLNNFITGTNGVTGARGYSCMPVSWYLAGASAVAE